MDLAAIIGTLGAFGVVILGVSVSAIGPAGLPLLLDYPSIAIVLGGTLLATIGSNPLELTFPGLFKSIGKVFKSKSVPLIETLVIIVDVAKVARKNVLAIEDSLPSIENEFLRNGLRLVVDRVDKDLITDIMMSEMKYADQKKTIDMGVVKGMSVYSPAFGMIGTLIGLVMMLADLSDPNSIGPNMSVALITTLYGALMSNGVFLPWATALDSARKSELVLYEMVRDGILFIEKNERAEFIEQDLMNYLTPELKAKYEELKFSREKGK
ncbi:MAG: motility protein A [Deltaproteobacteria bacterium]|jgi:chemotaxis protein MotA|nr:motility protein A [Deltaproteobacteria bacterium]MBT4090302.1 motility protein A [Deltaproteobacteria bacterium]MBT4267280.1 motility protein A [Deltaproteobacteria bacterium]MBT4639372.1 motility protein A [Deltaproteobacteria bacterium]MBT6504865.1 motility protein A [Deltaproteobacteria bacterium]